MAGSLTRIPESLHAAVRERAGRGEGGEAISEWLRAEHKVQITGRSVRRFLQIHREERREITKAALTEELVKKAPAYLDALQGVLDRALADERAIGERSDMITETERVALSDIGEAFDEKGKLLPLASMKPEVRRAIRSVKTNTIYGEDGETILVTEVTFWDKTKALVDLVSARAALKDKEMAIKARDQVLRAVAMGLGLDSDKTPPGNQGGVIVLPEEKD
jgi:hypothetical protein